MRVAKTEHGLLSQTALDDHVYLIRYASKLFSRKTIPILDYWDFYGEGILSLIICLSKWEKEEDKEGFSRYFKTALFRRFQYIRSKTCKKERLRASTVVDYGCDGGFGKIAYRELCTYVASDMNQPDRTIFLLFTDPPENLTKLLLQESKKREKHIVDPKVRLNRKHLFKYLNSNGCSITYAQFNSALKRVKDKVVQVCRERRTYFS